MVPHSTSVTEEMMRFPPVCLKLNIALRKGKEEQRERERERERERKGERKRRRERNTFLEQRTCERQMAQEQEHDSQEQKRLLQISEWK